MDLSTDQLPTPSQTVGPYFGFALPWPEGPSVVAEDHAGAVWIRGRVIDGAGNPIPDALVESWQANEAGVFPRRDGPGDPSFRGFGRCPTDRAGTYGIRTVKPGRVSGPDGRLQAPHIDLALFMRGLLRPVITRIYFPDDPHNASDPLLSSVPEAQRGTLIASSAPDGYRFDIRLQGDGETAFFDL